MLLSVMCVLHAEFAIVDEAYPFVAKMLLTDDSPRLRSALKYMVYGKDSVFDADRLIDLLAAFEDFSVASKSAQGDMDVGAPRPGSTFKLPSQPGTSQTAGPSSDRRSRSNGQASTSTGYNHNGRPSSASGNSAGKAGSRLYGNNSSASAGAGTYASVDGYGAPSALNGQGNGYGNGYSSSNGNSAYTAMQPYSGQGSMASNERQDSGQHAGSSTGNPWGSWGGWPSQVPSALLEAVTCCCAISELCRPWHWFRRETLLHCLCAPPHSPTCVADIQLQSTLRCYC